VEEGQVLCPRQRRIEIDDLGDVTKSRARRRRVLKDRLPKDQRLALARLKKAEEKVQRRRLARAVRTKKADDLARSDGQVEMIQSRVSAEASGQPPGFEHRGFNDAVVRHEIKSITTGGRNPVTRSRKTSRNS
jgi:hypothetical protein